MISGIQITEIIIHVIHIMDLSLSVISILVINDSKEVIGVNERGFSTNHSEKNKKRHAFYRILIRKS